MWSEIEGILNTSGTALSVLDTVAAVNYMEWDS